MVLAYALTLCIEMVLAVIGFSVYCVIVKAGESERYNTVTRDKADEEQALGIGIGIETDNEGG